MKVNLFTISLSENDNPIRVEEFKFSIEKNKNTSLNYFEINNVHRKTTYNDFFKEFEKYPNDINIIANKDIFFTQESIDSIIDFFSNYKKDIKKLCLALSRWEYINENSSNFFNAKDSQDCWIFYGTVEYNNRSDVPLGVPGCDNRIASELIYNYKYEVLNLGPSIKTYHYHPSGDSTRSYLNPDYSRNCYVEGPYEFLIPCKIEDYEKK
jgi:hypothetical protein